VQGPVAIAPGSDGLVHLAYSLRVTNTLPGTMTIQSLDIVDPFAGNKPLAKNRAVAADNQEIGARLDPVPAPPSLDGSVYTNVLHAGASGILFLDVTFDTVAAVPRYISHRMSVSQVDEQGQEQTYTVTDAPVVVDRSDPIVLSAPLHGERWIDGDSCCQQIGGHRWAMNPVNGRTNSAEVFALDLIQLRQDGRIFSGPIHQLSSYEYYGAGVYCAAPGKVVEVVRNLPDEVPGATPKVTAENAAGNHVIIEMDGKRYAMYAHFIPFSIPVHVGDSVKTGQLLGKVGNSGSSSAPHLHFQVMDSPSALDAHGLPFVIDHMRRRFRYGGSLNDEAKQTVAGEPLTLAPANPVDLQNKMPLTFDVLDF
jgi:hypothetical protein